MNNPCQYCGKRPVVTSLSMRPVWTGNDKHFIRAQQTRYMQAARKSL